MTVLRASSLRRRPGLACPGPRAGDPGPTARSASHPLAPMWIRPRLGGRGDVSFVANGVVKS